MVSANSGQVYQTGDGRLCRKLWLMLGHAGVDQPGGQVRETMLFS